MIETLTCLGCSTHFDRVMTRGIKPKNCPYCQGLVEVARLERKRLREQVRRAKNRELLDHNQLIDLRTKPVSDQYGLAVKAVKYRAAIEHAFYALRTGRVQEAIQVLDSVRT